MQDLLRSSHVKNHGKIENPTEIDISIGVSIDAHHLLDHMVVMSSGVPFVQQELLPAKPHRLHSATADRTGVFGEHVPGRNRLRCRGMIPQPTDGFVTLKRHMGLLGYVHKYYIHMYVCVCVRACVCG